MSEAEPADRYDRTRDVPGFDVESPVILTRGVNYGDRTQLATPILDELAALDAPFAR